MKRKNKEPTRASQKLHLYPNLVSLTNFNMVASVEAFNGGDVEVQVNIDELLPETGQK